MIGVSAARAFSSRASAAEQSAAAAERNGCWSIAMISRAKRGARFAARLGMIDLRGILGSYAAEREGEIFRPHLARCALKEQPSLF